MNFDKLLIKRYLGSILRYNKLTRIHIPVYLYFSLDHEFCLKKLEYRKQLMLWKLNTFIFHKNLFNNKLYFIKTKHLLIYRVFCEFISTQFYVFKISLNWTHIFIFYYSIFFIYYMKKHLFNHLVHGDWAICINFLNYSWLFIYFI